MLRKKFIWFLFLVNFWWMFLKWYFCLWNLIFMYVYFVLNFISKWCLWIWLVVLLKVGFFWNLKFIWLKYRWIELENFNFIIKVYFCFVMLWMGEFIFKLNIMLVVFVWIWYVVIWKYIDLMCYLKEIVWIFFYVDKEGIIVEFGDF